MKRSQPSIEDWGELYSAAVEFKKLECWEWMMDSDVFGVQNPKSGEIGYCCIMGELGEHLAMAVYLGTEGLESYLKIQRGEITGDDPSAMATQKCLMASFEDREFLAKEDLEIIGRLGLKFRGRKEWPFFRSFRPGYYPWFLTKDEAEYLTLALWQAIDVATRFKEDPDMLTPSEEDLYMVRVSKEAEGKLQWEDKWLAPEPKEKTKIAVPPVNEIRLQKIKNVIKRGRGIWEADFFFSPIPVKEETDERPYYPYAVFYVDNYSGLILNFSISKPQEHIAEFIEKLMELLEGGCIAPSEILVRKEEAYELLKPIADRLKIRLELVEILEKMEYLQSSMFEFLR